MKYYLAGPMTGYDKDNLPAFIEAARELRDSGFDIVTPAEFEGDEIAQRVLAGEGTFNEVAGKTWGYVLARDVELITGEIDCIVFLDGWENSRGARLEAFVGILCDRKFYRYLTGGQLEEMSAKLVLTKIARYTNRELNKREK